MQDDLVVPVWHNREVHRDFENWSFRKKTIYNAANYLDVGGHGTLIDPVTLRLKRFRQYKNGVTARGCLLAKEFDDNTPVDFVAYETTCGEIVYGSQLSGLKKRSIDGSRRKEIFIEKPISLKVESFNKPITTVASYNAVHLLKGDELTNRVDCGDKIEAYAASPYVDNEVVTVCGDRLMLSCDSMANLRQTVVNAHDTTFWTHPRHVALVSSNSVVHGDLRIAEAASFRKVVDGDCLNLLPKESFFTVSLNPTNVNQIFVVASDTISLWDARYHTQPMCVHNHYVPRMSTLHPLQTMVCGESLWLLVRSSSCCTIFQFDGSSSNPNPILLSYQLQLASPVDAPLYFVSQTGEDVSDKVWRRLREPLAGSCILNPSDKSNEFEFISVTVTGDWFHQKLLIDDEESLESKERCYSFGMDCASLNDEQLEEIRRAMELLQEPTPNISNSLASICITNVSLQLATEGSCTICSNSSTAEGECSTCGLTESNIGLVESWNDSGLLREASELTDEEQTRCRELLSANASGLDVSDEIRAAWGEVDWRILGEAGDEVAGGEEPQEDDEVGEVEEYED